jgi:uncharacterized protein YeaO (DUF488 family)
MLKTKRVYDAPGPEDGFRLLIMRKWPRGTRRETVDAWEKDLGPSLGLLEDWRKGRVDWPEFARRYRQEMEAMRGAILSLAQRTEEETVTLLCGCEKEDHCHRSLLKALIEEAGMR